jgi:hypothetical protein
MAAHLLMNPQPEFSELPWAYISKSVVGLHHHWTRQIYVKLLWELVGHWPIHLQTMWMMMNQMTIVMIAQSFVGEGPCQCPRSPAEGQR